MEQSQSTLASQSTFRAFLNRHVTGIDIIAGVVIVLLAMSTVFMYTQRQELARQLESVRHAKEMVSLNERVLVFMQLFIDKVLKSEGEIDFETRLALEASVRALDNQVILTAWQRFTESKTERDAQKAVKDLLGVLVSEIQ